MPSNFVKTLIQEFDKEIAGFDDMLVIGKAAEVYTPASPQEMHYAGDEFWLPAPMIGSTYDGFDQTANFGSLTETQVKVSIGYHKSDPRQFSAKEARAERSISNWIKHAKQKLASDINLSVSQTVALQAANVIKRSGSPTGWDDLALAKATLTEIGVSPFDSNFFAAPRIANAMTKELAGRATDNSRDASAYEKAKLGEIAGFGAYENDTPITLAAAAGGATTINGANQYYTPKATVLDALGVNVNVDNRYSDLVVTAANYAGIKAGDAFTIAGVNSLHRITKQDTGQLQTFRVVGKPGANTIRITPALVSNGGNTRAEKEYQNVSATPANGAAITWLNTTTAQVNPFFKRESLLLIPGSYAVDDGDGWQVSRYTTDLGINISLVMQGEINDLSKKVRMDVDYGTALISPEMAGIELFNQA